MMEIIEYSINPKFPDEINKHYNQLKVLYEILDNLVGKVEDRLKDSDIHLKLTDAAKYYFVNTGYEEAFGARPLKRIVNRELETKLAKKLLNNEVKYGDTIIIDCVNNEIVLK